jgi:hypothetical protein
LDIVVVVDEEGGLVGAGGEVFGKDDRVSGGLPEGGFKLDGLEELDDPVSAFEDVIFVGVFGADALESEEFGEFLEEGNLVIREVGGKFLGHGIAPGFKDVIIMQMAMVSSDR